MDPIAAVIQETLTADHADKYDSIQYMDDSAICRLEHKMNLVAGGKQARAFASQKL